MLGSCHCTALLFVGATIFSTVAAGACGPSEREVYVGGRWGCIPAATSPGGSTGEPVGGGAPGSVQSPVPYPPRAKPLPGVTAELWRDITAVPSAPWTGARPAVFTYVLSGDVGGDATYKGTDQRILRARANLDALVAEARSFDKAKPGASLKSANLFCIPTKSPESANGAAYDHRLARSYRQRLQELLADQSQLRDRLGGIGPFLVATRLPVNEIVREGSSRDNHIVLIDLSSAEPQSVIVFMNEFKNAIRRDDVLADKELAPLRPAIVSTSSCKCCDSVHRQRLRDFEEVRYEGAPNRHAQA